MPPVFLSWRESSTRSGYTEYLCVTLLCLLLWTEREIYDSEGHRCHTHATFITGCLEINGCILMDTLKRLSGGRSIFLCCEEYTEWLCAKAELRFPSANADSWCQLSLVFEFYYWWGLDYMSIGGTRPAVNQIRSRKLPDEKILAHSYFGRHWSSLSWWIWLKKKVHQKMIYRRYF